MGGDFFVKNAEKARLNVVNFRTGEVFEIDLSEWFDDLEEGDELQLEKFGLRVR